MYKKCIFAKFFLNKYYMVLDCVKGIYGETIC